MLTPSIRWVMVGIGSSAILCLIAILLVRVVIRSLYEFDIFDNSAPNEWTFHTISFGLALGLAGLLYVATFIKSTYSDQERNVLTLQLGAITIGLILIPLVLLFRQPTWLIGTSILWGLAGLSSIIFRIGVIARHRFLVSVENRGWLAIVTGLVEIVIAGFVLYLAIYILK